MTQTIANGATLPNIVGWRAVYDRNGDKVADDPGQVQFLVDGKLVVSEQLMPFGDSFADGSITVPSGQHTFQVRASSDSGTVLATNTVTATINNTGTTPPPPAPPAGDTAPPSSPSNLRVGTAAATTVTVAWNAATDNVGVAGYGLYRGSSSTGETPQTTATYNGLSCGTAYQVGVDAYDAADNRSARANLAVSTSACADSQPPTAPTSVTASARTTHQHHPHLGACDRQRRRRRLRHLQGRRARPHHRRRDRHRRRPRRATPATRSPSTRSTRQGTPRRRRRSWSRPSPAPIRLLRRSRGT